MPGSTELGKQFIKKWFEDKDIKVVLDLGVGIGTYRKLLGDSYYWIGVEIWQPYIDKYNLENLYDVIINKDITKMKLPKADCVILGDVIEHLEKDEAWKLLEKVNKNYKHLVISLPLGPWEQGTIDGNVHEAHLSEWKYGEINDMLDDLEVSKEIERMGIFLR